jgi:signal transduction histidine kinase/CheY-like chemotaxis protein
MTTTIEVEPTSPPAGGSPGRRAHGRRPWPYLVFAVLALGAVLLATTVNRVVDDQEHRLLDQQARAAASLVSSGFGGMSTLPLLGALADPSIGSPQLFTAVAQGFASNDGSVGTALRRDGGFVVQAEAGDGPATGTSLTGSLGALVDRAASAGGLVTDVTKLDGRQHLAFAVPSPTSKDVVVYAEMKFDASMLTQSADQPFSELDGALYIGDRPDADKVLLATKALPITGSTVVRKTVDVGKDHWLLVVTPKHSLVGGLAERLPWMILGGGLVTAVLLSALVGAISRRRAYALRLVDERTRELRAALAERERLEEGQRLAREAAEEANRSKSEFLSRMSHELRTPLNAVLGFAQLLETDDLDPGQQDSVKQILHGGRHLLGLINEVLDITRIETGTFQLSPEPVGVRDVVDEVIELARPLAAAAEVQLSRGITGLDEHVLADRQRLKQILLNLVGNAIKYNRRGGTVVVSCEHVESSKLRVKVHDTGMGIRPEHLELLFTPFERLGAEHTSVEGTGVGLALSRRLAEAMGGVVDLETVVGQGSTFWVELPVVEDPVQRFERLDEASAPASAARETTSRRHTVLYIEDNLSNLRLVQRILESHPGIELLTAMQGHLGFELAKERVPSLVLLDMHLPDITGDQVLRQLRDDPATSSIPVVVLSADATAGQIKRTLAEGARAYLTKPLDVSELREILDELPALA